MGDLGAESLASILPHNNHLLYLNIGHNQIASNGTQALSNGLQNNSKLITLEMYDNPIGDGGIIAFSEMLKINTELKHLPMWLNRFSSSGMNRLMRGFSEHRSFLSIDLGSNNFSASDAGLLAQGLSNNPLIQVLYIDDNPLKGNGLAILSPAIQNHTSLRSLHFNNDQITDVGFVSFMNSLANNSRISELHFARNLITGDGTPALIDFVRRNQFMRAIDFSNNPIPNATAEALLAGFKNSPSLISINFKDTGIDINIQYQLDDIALRNRQRPFVSKNTLAIAQGETVNLTNSDVQIDEGCMPAIRVLSARHGQFSRNGQLVNEFSSAELADKRVQFTHDGSPTPPEYTLEAYNNCSCNNTLSSGASDAKITFALRPQPPTTAQPTNLPPFVPDDSSNSMDWMPILFGVLGALAVVVIVGYLLWRYYKGKTGAQEIARNGNQNGQQGFINPWTEQQALQLQENPQHRQAHEYADPLRHCPNPAYDHLNQQDHQQQAEYNLLRAYSIEDLRNNPGAFNGTGGNAVVDNPLFVDPQEVVQQQEQPHIAPGHALAAGGLLGGAGCRQDQPLVVLSGHQNEFTNA